MSKRLPNLARLVACGAAVTLSFEASYCRYRALFVVGQGSDSPRRLCAVGRTPTAALRQLDRDLEGFHQSPWEEASEPR